MLLRTQPRIQNFTVGGIAVAGLLAGSYWLLIRETIRFGSALGSLCARQGVWAGL